MRVVKYQRISTNHQDLENQTQSIDTQLERPGWDCIGEYKEIESGMKSRDTRPQLRRLLRDSRLRLFDRVIVYSLDRLGRSVVDVINTINELEDVGVNVFMVKNSIDTSTQQGKLFTYFCSIFGEMERDATISHGASRFTKERIYDVSDKYHVHICNMCGLIVPFNEKEKIHYCKVCENRTNFSYIEIPYSCKLLFHELIAMNVVPRIMTSTK